MPAATATEDESQSVRGERRSGGGGGDALVRLDLLRRVVLASAGLVPNARGQLFQHHSEFAADANAFLEEAG